MSANPFQADPAVTSRLAAIPTQRLAALRQRAREVTREAVITANDAADLVAAFDLSGKRDLMLLLLDDAKAFARPPISQFFVGAVGLEAPSGDLILGGNVEFPGSHLGYTIHGEGCVATRAFLRGGELVAIAIGEAHPCAHCRQYLSEFASGGRLELIDPLGHELTLEQLYPWPFDPNYLGEKGARPGGGSWSALTLKPSDLAPDLAVDLLEATRMAHAPYSRCPAGLVIELDNGRRLSGCAIESVAFNPTMGPLQAATIALLASGAAYDDIRHVALATMIDGAVDYAASTRELLASMAPAAQLTVVGLAQ